MKAIMTSVTLLSYANINQPFDIKTNVSNYQLGAVFKQDGCPITYYSRKLSPAQACYTTIEKELLSIIEMMKTFWSMLQGGKIRVHMDHKNLTHAMTAFTAQHVLRWRLLLDKFLPSFYYLPGTQNAVADMLSCLP